jgi:16S rRNA (cytosine1402-N4)-methyltransferase
MTGRRSIPHRPAGQAAEPEPVKSAGHIPVLLDAVVDALAPRDDAVYVDGTFGGGGYSEALLNAARCRVFGIDRDPAAVRRGRDLAERHGERLRVLEGRFGDMAQLLAPVNTGPVAGIALDLGVSSTQLDTPERGFSFRFDGPLDMRMSGAGQSAADLVATLSEPDLAELIRALGEERFARRIARAINAARQRRTIQRTTELADIVRAAVPQSEPGHDPATRTFQALRIAVNDELGELDRGLAAAEQLLMPGGRLAVVSFHSLEDRRVKEFLRRRSDMAPRASRHRPVGTESPAPSFTLLTRRAVKPSAAEIAHNPRARAARLRAAARTAAPPWPRNNERHVGGGHRGQIA